MRRFERASRPAAILPRLVIVVALAALAGYLWFGDPLQADSRRAAQFCAGLQPGTPVIRIMQEARRQGATGFSTPQPEELRVAFGKAACTLPLRAGAFAG